MGKTTYTIVLAIASAMIFSSDSLQANDGEGFTGRQTPSTYLRVVNGKIRLNGNAPEILRSERKDAGDSLNQLKLKAAKLQTKVTRLEIQKKFAKESAEELMSKVSWISEKQAIQVVIGAADINRLFAVHLKETGNLAGNTVLAEN